MLRFLLIVGLLTATLCLTSCLGVVARIFFWGDPAITCVATYHSVAPGVSVGADGCGNIWVRDKNGCRLIEGDSLIVMPSCPDEGDSLAVRR